MQRPSNQPNQPRCYDNPSLESSSKTAIVAQSNHSKEPLKGATGISPSPHPSHRHSTSTSTTVPTKNGGIMKPNSSSGVVANYPNSPNRMPRPRVPNGSAQPNIHGANPPIVPVVSPVRAAPRQIPQQTNHSSAIHSPQLSHSGHPNPPPQRQPHPGQHPQRYNPKNHLQSPQMQNHPMKPQPQYQQQRQQPQRQYQPQLQQQQQQQQQQKRPPHPPASKETLQNIRPLQLQPHTKQPHVLLAPSVVANQQHLQQPRQPVLPKHHSHQQHHQPRTDPLQQRSSHLQSAPHVAQMHHLQQSATPTDVSVSLPRRDVGDHSGPRNVSGVSGSAVRDLHGATNSNGQLDKSLHVAQVFAHTQTESFEQRDSHQDVQLNRSWTSRAGSIALASPRQSPAAAQASIQSPHQAHQPKRYVASLQQPDVPMRPLVQQASAPNQRNQLEPPVVFVTQQPSPKMQRPAYSTVNTMNTGPPMVIEIVHTSRPTPPPKQRRPESFKGSSRAAVHKPRDVDETTGSRVRVILGPTGQSFLLLLHEDNGQHQWQNRSWRNVPFGLDQRLRTVDYIHQCAFTEHEWFLSARSKVTGTTETWWEVQSQQLHQALEVATAPGILVRVVFGDMSIGQFIILLGLNGFTLGENIPESLQKILERINATETAVARIRGLNASGRFLLEEARAPDSIERDNTSSNSQTVFHSDGISPYLLGELKLTATASQTAASDLIDIALGSNDKAWLVVRHETYDGSAGVHEEVINRLDAFYARFRQRRVKAQVQAQVILPEVPVEQSNAAFTAKVKEGGVVYEMSDEASVTPEIDEDEIIVPPSEESLEVEKFHEPENEDVVEGQETKNKLEQKVETPVSVYDDMFDTSKSYFANLPVPVVSKPVKETHIQAQKILPEVPVEQSNAALNEINVSPSEESPEVEKFHEPENEDVVEGQETKNKPEQKVETPVSVYDDMFDTSKSYFANLPVSVVSKPVKEKFGDTIDQSCMDRWSKYESAWYSAPGKKRGKEDRLKELERKFITIGDKVTVCGQSTEFGDAFVVDIERDSGFVSVNLPYQGTDDNLVLKSRGVASTVEDPRQLIRFVKDSDYYERNEVFLLAHAHDKYEAAVMLFHNQCPIGSCACKRDFMGYSHQMQQPNHWKVGDRVNVISYTDGVVIEPHEKYATKSNLVHVLYDDGTSYHVSQDLVRPEKRFVSPVQCSFQLSMKPEEEEAMRLRPVIESLTSSPREFQPFAEHICAEKIDLRRLQKLAANFRSDCTERRQYMDELAVQLETQPDNLTFDYAYRKLVHCYDLEETVFMMHEVLKHQTMDPDGCVVHEVQYRHKDASCRGRLFSIGRQVRVLGWKFPRTLTIQGIQAELHVPLTGAFAHYIDCENSDVRLLCSLAQQVGCDDIIPTLKSYSDFRSKILPALQFEQNGVSEAELKRLPNYILSGGTYDSWLKAVEETQVALPVKQFCFRLYTEIRAVRDQLLAHPRFQWTIAEHDKLERQGLNSEAINVSLLTMILQASENEVQRILHRTFHNRGWIVRAKLFDSLLVERGAKGRAEKSMVQDLMRLAERTCEAQGWNIKLVEKSLHGRQSDPLSALTEARSILRERRMEANFGQGSSENQVDGASRL